MPTAWRRLFQIRPGSSAHINLAAGPALGVGSAAAHLSASTQASPGPSPALETVAWDLRELGRPYFSGARTATRCAVFKAEVPLATRELRGRSTIEFTQDDRDRSSSAAR